jgi:hypothetical protein
MSSSVKAKKKEMALQKDMKELKSEDYPPA